MPLITIKSIYFKIVLIGLYSAFSSNLFAHEPILICHRAMSGYPENTKIGLKAAIKAGYQIVECDIARTKDGIFVLSHDATIDRCSNGKGKIEDLTYKQLKKYDFGVWYDSIYKDTRIVTLEKMLKICRRKKVSIELDLADEKRFKNEYMLDIYNLVEKKRMLNYTFFTAKKNRLLQLRNVDKKNKTIGFCCNK